MDFDKIYGGHHLKADDVRGAEVRWEIGKVVEADMKQRDGTTAKKWVLYFVEQEKTLPLNKTNARNLAKAFGKNSADWIGREVDLQVVSTSFGDGIQVDPVSEPPEPKSKPKPDDMGGDEIPPF
jgi:hypothetical protein